VTRNISLLYAYLFCCDVGDFIADYPCRRYDIREPGIADSGYAEIQPLAENIQLKTYNL
jgi:hypothetical protein